MQNTQWYALGAVVVIALGAWFFLSEAPAPSFDLALAAGDRVENWDFKGAYTGNAELETRAQAEIARLEALIGRGEDTDYSLNVSIANQYDLLGDGANELAYLERALAIDSLHTGLAWYNAGRLFERLSAPNTALMAYQRAAEAQPTPQYIDAAAEFASGKTSFQ